MTQLNEQESNLAVANERPTAEEAGDQRSYEICTARKPSDS